MRDQAHLSALYDTGEGSQGTSTGSGDLGFAT